MRFPIIGALLALSATGLHAQITYIDATTANTARVDGNTFSPVSTSNVYTDSNWSLRTGLASGGSIFEGGGGEAVPMLRQTVNGVAPGYYDVYVFFWVANNVNWQINAGLATSTNNFGSVGTATTPAGVTSLASTATYAPGAAPTVFAEADRTLIRAKLGQFTVASDGILRVFATTGAIVNNNTTNSRTWFDGIGYGPYEPLPGNATDIAPDGAWTWFNDERSIIHQGSLYTGYVKAAGQIGITRRNLATGATSHMIVSTAASQQQDDHDNPSITALPDGRLMALYSKHISGSQFYQRTSLVQQPSSNADWGPEITITTPAANTYANTYKLSSEANAIYDFSRCINFNPTLTISTDNGTTWGSSRQLIGTGGGSTRPYPRYCSNGTDRIDLIYTDGHPRDVDNSVYHMFYRAGGLFKTDGTLIDSLTNIPLDHDSGKRGNVVYPFSTAAWGAGQGPDDWIPNARGWTWDVHYGPGENPVCVFQAQVGTDATWSTSRIYYYYARWTGSQWQRKFIAQAGRGIYAAESDYGGGMCLDPIDPRIVYISSNAASPFSLGDIANVPLRANNRFEIYRGFTADGGLTFSWTPVTENSANDNLRPIVPPNHGRRELLLWFNGTYNTYTSFSTRVLGRIGDATPSFATWAAANSASTAPGADSDQDGLADLLEFALDGNPSSTASRPSPTLNGNAFRFRYPTNRQGIEWQVETSSDLTHWQTAAILRGGLLPDETSGGFTTTLNGGYAEVAPPATAVPKRFLRLKVLPTN